jgi:inosine-uridine nucleoside N-ribohydrolase
VIDTDAANEIDDQFAIAWALRAADRIELEAVLAAPFSHGRFFHALAAASAVRGGPSSDLDRIGCRLPPERMKALIEEHPPALGMQRSFEEIGRVFEAAGVSTRDRILRGAPDFMPGPAEPVASEAVDRLIELAHTASPASPIYVAAIGAPTNVASALLTDPAIAEHLVVLFVAGYPSGAGIDDDSFNLVQDRYASNVLFESEVPLVYMPGYHVAETIQLSWPAAEYWLAGDDPLSALLLDRYRNNPINPSLRAPGRSWVLWDLITIAWLMDRDWVPTREVPRARVDRAHRFETLPGRPMQEAYRVKRNELFEDLFARLDPTRGASAERERE